MRDNPRPFEIYRHFKGNQYQILTLAKDSEDGRPMVVYQALYGDYTVYVRELSQFMSPVDRAKYPDVAQTYRFEKVGSEMKTPLAESEPGQDTEMQPAESEPGQDTEMQPAEPEPGQDTEKQPAKFEQAEKTVFESAIGVQEAEEEVTRKNAAMEPADEEFVLDPMVEAFLDTDALDEKLNILAGLHHRITKEMLATMAVVSDIELNEGSVEEQYVELRDYLLMKEKFECKRTW